MSLVSVNMAIDQRNRLKEEPFSYQITKSGLLRISFQGRVVTQVKGKKATQFAKLAPTLSEEDIQLRLAKLTGHFKHGNERSK